MRLRWTSPWPILTGIVLVGTAALLVFTLGSMQANLNRSRALYDTLLEEYTQLYEQTVSAGIDPDVSAPSEVGTPGAAGEPGPRGPAGPQGPAGQDGVDGPDGAPGVDGSPGPQGPTGAPGADGATGAAGADGQDGADGAPGAPGETGPQGPAGVDGVDGADGRGVVSVTCEADGSWLITYTDDTTSTTPGPCRIPAPDPEPTVTP